jgi:hypothetical protein
MKYWDYLAPILSAKQRKIKSKAIGRSKNTTWKDP